MQFEHYFDNSFDEIGEVEKEGLVGMALRGLSFFTTHKAEKASKSAYGHVKIGDGLTVVDGVVSANIADASTIQKGIVQLNDTVTSASVVQAATANAVKTAMDRADAAFTSVSNRKMVVVNAVTGKGGTIPINPSYDDLATAIAGIPEGVKHAFGSFSGQFQNNVTIGTMDSLGFIPNLIVFNFRYLTEGSGKGWESRMAVSALHKKIANLWYNLAFLGTSDTPIRVPVKPTSNSFTVITGNIPPSTTYIEVDWDAYEYE